MAKLYNRARMTVTSTGTGTLTLGSAVTQYNTFAAAGVSNGDVVSYTIEDGANWEIGTGTYTSVGTTLSRTPSASSNAGSAISVTTSAQVYVTALSADIVNPANLGTGVNTALGVAVGSAGAVVVNGGALGTPSSGTLTSCSGLPISTGVSGLGTGVASGLAVAALGSGGPVLGTSATLTTPTATGLKETKTAPTISTNTLTLDCSTGNVFNVSLNANVTTLSFSNVPSTGTAYGLTLSLSITGSFTVTWPASVKWPGGTAPTLTTTSGKTDTFVLFTYDGGTTWFAFTAGQNA